MRADVGNGAVVQHDDPVCRQDRDDAQDDQHQDDERHIDFIELIVEQFLFQKCPFAAVSFTITVLAGSHKPQRGCCITKKEKHPACGVLSVCDGYYSLYAP